MLDTVVGFRKAADVNWWARRAPGGAHLAVRARPRGASRCTRGEPPRTATAGPRERLAGASRTFFELANVPPISCVRAENTLFVLRVRVSRNARGHRRHGSARGAFQSNAAREHGSVYARLAQLRRRGAGGLARVHRTQGGQPASKGCFAAHWRRGGGRASDAVAHDERHTYHGWLLFVAVIRGCDGGGGVRLAHFPCLSLKF